MSRVIAPNSNLGRAMFVWDKSLVDTTQKALELVSFCTANAVNTILLSMYSWIGGTNWSVENICGLSTLIRSLKDAGIMVHALAGNHDWPQNQNWVKTNITSSIGSYNKIYPRAAFDGVVFDIEYWTQTYDLDEYLPKFCKLIAATRSYLNIPVGCFVARFLLDGGRDNIEYDGVNDVDGVHLVKWSDMIFVGSYGNTANTGSNMGQIEMMADWIEVADDQLRCAKQIWSCTETKDVSPSWITYYGKMKSEMETEHAIISSAYNSVDGSSFVGQAIHDYDAYRNMT